MVFPQREALFVKSIYYYNGFRVARRTNCFVPPAAGCSPEATHSDISAPACHKTLQQSNVFSPLLFSAFHNLTGVPILAMFLTWHQHVIKVVVHRRYQNFDLIENDTFFQWFCNVLC